MKPDFKPEFISKGQGRIFVFRKCDIAVVKNVIRDCDLDYDYLPENFIAVYEGNIDDLVYTGKFDPDIPVLIQKCAEQKVGIICRSIAPKQWIEI